MSSKNKKIWIGLGLLALGIGAYWYMKKKGATQQTVPLPTGATDQIPATVLPPLAGPVNTSPMPSPTTTVTRNVTNTGVTALPVTSIITPGASTRPAPPTVMPVPPTLIAVPVTPAPITATPSPLSTLAIDPGYVAPLAVSTANLNLPGAGGGGSGRIFVRTL